MDGQNLVNLAYHLAVVAHDGQYRKGSGEPYMNHVDRVANGVYGWKAICVAYLHDVVEDTNVSLEAIYQLFPEEIVDAVIILTRNPDDPLQATYMDYIALVASSGNDLAIKVKLSDLDDNMRDTEKLSPEHREFAIRRYTRAKSLILDVLDAVERRDA